MVQGVQFRRGTTAQHSVFTGQPGEITVDTDKKVVVVHDGTTTGGFELVNVSVGQTLSNKTFSGVSTFVSIATSSLTVQGGTLVSGVVTATSFSGSGANLTGIIAGVGIQTSSGLVGTGATILDFRGSGISTITVSSGIATINITGGSSTQFSRTTTSFTATANQTTFSATYTVGYVDVYINGIKLEGSEYTATDGSNVVLLVGATVGDIVEIIGYQNINFTSVSYTSTAGIATYATTSGIATYATSSGIATYSTTSGVSTSVIGGISSVTQLQVAGVSTFTNGPVLIGSGTSTGTTSQRLQVTGGASFTGTGSSVGIGTTNPTDALTVLGRVQIQQNASSNSRLVLRAVPGNAYRWSIDNDSSNNFRIFREDDATAANGAVYLQISSSGNVTLPGNTTISGNLNAATNYYVKLGRTTNQTIPNGVDTPIGFSVISDQNSWYSGITTRTTPTVAGTYHVDGMVNWNAGSIKNNQTNIQLRKNGITFALSQVGIQTDFAYTMNICGIVTMNGSTDYIDFTVYTGNPTSQVITGDAGGAWTKMEIFKIN